MVRSKRIKPIVNMAHDMEREAARALGEALKGLSDSERQLNLLFSYRDEYSEKLKSCGSQGMTAQALNEYRHFMAKINDAIENQKASVEQAQRRLDEKKEFWFAKRGSSQALDKVLDRYLDEERKQQDKRAQKEIDDRSAQKTSIY